MACFNIHSLDDHHSSRHFCNDAHHFCRVKEDSSPAHVLLCLSKVLGSLFFHGLCLFHHHALCSLHDLLAFHLHGNGHHQKLFQLTHWLGNGWLRIRMGTWA